jgi:Cysteine-rich secretory protein family
MATRYSFRFLSFVLGTMTFLACSSESGTPSAGTGGAVADASAPIGFLLGGSQATGGTPTTGGSVATGGSALTGGTATGGTTAMGGAGGAGGAGGTGGAIATGGSPADAGTVGTGGASSRAVEVCGRWTADRVDMTEGTWTGNADSCTPGDLTGSGRANALRLLNLYRFLTGMPTVTEDPTMDALAQGCALLQTANNSLNHTPPTTWLCYTAEWGAAAGKSSLSGGGLVRSIDGYMAEDASNAATMGHRRWIFNNALGPVGFGMTKASCFYQMGGTGKANMPFVPWPPSGPVPMTAITTTKVDTNGWTIQSDSANVNAGTVTVTDNGQPAAVTQTSLGANYGSKYAIRFLPSGWKTQAGHTYAVTVSGTTVSYTVQPVDCATVN